MHQNATKQRNRLLKWKLYLSALMVAILVHLVGLKYLFPLPSLTLVSLNNVSSISVSLRRREASSFHWWEITSRVLLRPLSGNSLSSTQYDADGSRHNNNNDIFNEAQARAVESGQQTHDWVNGSSQTLSTDNFLNPSAGFSLHTVPMDGESSSKYFQPVKGQEAWLYSAYYQEESLPLVRIIGMANHSHIRPILFCHFEADNGQYLLSAPAQIIWFSDAHGLQMRTCELHCQINGSQRPYFVKVSAETQTSRLASNRLPIHYTGQRVRNFTVCLSIIHSNYDDSWQLVQTIEYNRLLGAEHFVVYYLDASRDVQTILRGYRDEGLLTILPWPASHIDIWYYGQLASISDCIHRNRNVSRFVVITDFDEIIIPNNHSNWWDMIQDLSEDVSLRDVDYLNETKFHESVTRRQYIPKEAVHGSKDLRKGYGGQAMPSRKQRSVDDEGVSGIQNKVGDYLRKGYGGQARMSRKQRSVDDDSDVFGIQNKLGGDMGVRVKNGKIIKDNADKLQSGSEEIKHNQFKQIDSFSFKCAFYVPKNIFMKTLVNYESLGAFTFSPDQISFLGKVHVAPLHDLVRAGSALKHGQRSKVIVRPEVTRMAGIHVVMRHRPGYNTVFTKPEVALLHHYRSYRFNSLNFIDTSALRFKDEFFQSIQRAIQRFPLLMKVIRGMRQAKKH